VDDRRRDADRLRQVDACKLEIKDARTLLRNAVEICPEWTSITRICDWSRPYSTECHVTAEVARLRRRFWNLIKKLREFPPDGGRSRSAPGHEAKSQSREQKLTIEFTDTGIASRPEVMSRIFDPFQTGARPRSRRKIRREGLGLAISRGVVKAHRGSLTATARGSARAQPFRIQRGRRPSRRVGPPSTGSRRRPPVALAAEEGLTILRVEDETRRRCGSGPSCCGGLDHDVVPSAPIAMNWSRRGRGLRLVISDIGLPTAVDWNDAQGRSNIAPSPARPQGLRTCRRSPPKPGGRLSAHMTSRSTSTRRKR